MATVPSTQPGISNAETITIPPLTVEEEDAIIHSRITNDERALRRVIKKFNSYTFVAHSPIAPVPDSPANSVDDAREAFLVELATFSLQLKKAVMVCEAEARQVEEYQRERHRIENERSSLRGHIEQLKASLEHAQLERRQKMEYDAFAEKINTLPSRAELEQSIQLLENDMAAIRADHDAQNRLIQAQKTSLVTIISDLGSLRLMGKETETPHDGTPAPVGETEPPPSSPLPPVDSEREEGEEGESSDELPLSAKLNPRARVFTPSMSRKSASVLPTVRSLRGGKLGISSAPATAVPSRAGSKAADEDDIEMGELAEEPKDVRGKKKARDEELEEGEASDQSSVLSDPPDD